MKQNSAHNCGITYASSPLSTTPTTKTPSPPPSPPRRPRFRAWRLRAIRKRVLRPARPGSAQRRSVERPRLRRSFGRIARARSVDRRWRRRRLPACNACCLPTHLCIPIQRDSAVGGGERKSLSPVKLQKPLKFTNMKGNGLCFLVYP